MKQRSRTRGNGLPVAVIAGLCSLSGGAAGYDSDLPGATLKSCLVRSEGLNLTVTSPSAKRRDSPRESRLPLLVRLRQLDARVEAIRDLVANMEEEKRTPLLKRPIRTTGTVKVRGGRSRWETDSPRASVLLIDQKEVRIYFPDRKTMEVYPVGPEFRFLTVGVLPRLVDLIDAFQIEAWPVDDSDSGAALDAADLLRIRLLPREPGLRERVREILVEIDEATGVGRRVEIVGADDGRTIIQFHGVRTNVGLTEDDVSFTLPPDATITYPFGAREPRPKLDATENHDPG